MSNDNTISFVIFKNNSGKSYTLTISQNKLKIASISLLAALIALGVGIYLSYNVNIQQAAYNKLKKDYSQKMESIKVLNEEIDFIKNDMIDLIEKEERLELLLGKARVKKKLRKKNIKKFKKELKVLEKSAVSSEERAFKLVNMMKNYVDEFNQKYSIHLKRTHLITARFEATPSIRPLYGRVMSRYGWRKHPVSKKRRFHKGIDIASWAGAPIHVTADGIVEYAGWSRTFGYVVVVNHNYGYRTYYAHCSQILVKRKEIVKKGQVIAQVGSTGLSTGPHLHYEIRKWNQRLNPIAYLDLDMFTARRRIW
ncbi:hypothetical protein CL647_00080 [bacterium]|nr:hypothetical protein [Actinomycetota bacterium]MBE32531.1 hypothetical protein [bacterium]|tara:strand:+ start:1830 stop:2759 length:930 start_codon:yes stop_codon:yes gene_type:complete